MDTKVSAQWHNLSMTFVDDLVRHLSKLPAAPFLFVGSGFSRRYVGADDWAGLLRRFTLSNGVSFERYASRANGSYFLIASMIADDFHDVWWEAEEFAEQREKWPSPRRRGSPLKIAVSEHLASAVDALPEEGPLAAEIEMLQKATVEGVITTNYDTVLEHLFPDFAVYSGQDELLFHDPQGVGEIYKIHGSATTPESLVLNDEDYRRFNERNSYLAAKLLTTFVEHPVLFVGYSLADNDVREILTSIAHVLTSDNLSKLQDRLIFVQWDPDVEYPTLAPSQFVADGMSLPMWSIVTPDYSGVFEALGLLKRRFPAKVLRRLKEQVYELVQTSEPRGKVYVSDIDADVDIAEIDVVIGVGVEARLSSQGVVGLSRQDLQRDVLKSELPEDADTSLAIVREVLPRYLKGRANTPIFKYLRGAGLLTDSGELLGDAQVPEAVKKRFDLGVGALRAPSGYIRKALTQSKAAGSFAELVRHNTLADVLFAAPHMSIESVNLGELRDFLVDAEDEALRENSLQVTQWGKCLCFYDLAAYKFRRYTS